MTPEEHLQAALEHIEAAQQSTPDALRGDRYLIRAATECKAAKTYTETAREATESDGPE